MMFLLWPNARCCDCGNLFDLSISLASPIDDPTYCSECLEKMDRPGPPPPPLSYHEQLAERSRERSRLERRRHRLPN
jgi:hypothetical protein